MLFNDTPARQAPNDAAGIYTFGNFTLDRARAVLLRDGREVALRPQSFEVLCYLVDRAGRVVSRDELMRAIWPDVVVTPDSLSQCLVDIRRALDDADRSLVRTVPRRGYRFDLPVERPRAPAGRKAATIPRVSGRFGLASAAVLALVLAGAAGVVGWPPTPAEPDGVVSASTPPSAQQIRAREYSLRGQFFHNRREAGDLDRAAGMFRQALAHDPGLADAWVGLAGSLYVQKVGQGARYADFAAEHRGYLQRALEIDPLHAEGNARLASHYLMSGDLDRARVHFDRALQQGGDDPIVLAMAAGQYHDVGQYARAVELQQRAVQRDPLNAINHGNLAHFLMADGRHDEARDALLVAIDLKPGSRQALTLDLADVDLLRGDYPAALVRVQDLPDSPARDRVRAIALLGQGAGARAQPLIERLAARPDAGAAVAVAEILAFDDRTDEALHWLAEASARQYSTGSEAQARAFFSNVRHSPFLQALAQEPGWQDWLAFNDARLGVKDSKLLVLNDGMAAQGFR